MAKSDIDCMVKHIFRLGVNKTIQSIQDEISFHFTGILGIRTVFASVLHAQITLHFAELKFKSNENQYIIHKNNKTEIRMHGLKK